MKEDFISKAREIFGDGFIPLHRPIFYGNEKNYLIDCIDSNFVSSVGEKVNEFEKKISDFTGAKFAIATMNGTSALHIAIKLLGVQRDDEVISQALTFVATCNAIAYTGAHPVFIDVDVDTMGMSPDSLETFLETSCEKRKGKVFNKKTGRRIGACVPMHTFGFPCRIREIEKICKVWGIPLIEDAAESLGSFVGEKHTGTFGHFGTLSFNGNKVITTGGGGMIITDNDELAYRAKHMTTTSKIPHPFKFIHDEVGYNYRLPNINAALGCAQIESIHDFLEAKKEVAKRWDNFFSNHDVTFVKPSSKTDRANFWLNTIILDSKLSRDNFLDFTNSNDVMTRPVWELMSSLDMFKDCVNDGLKNSKWLSDRIVNIPSSVPDKSL
tara:strand:- start:3602 stop:4750 length:1149 start_codon:yes stop_codon:yes gene_type:complete